MRLRKQRYVFIFGISVLVALTASIGATVAWAANHRSAPITALDNAAGIPDVFAFRSYETGATDKVTLIMTADPFREPGNGPVWFLFDDNILYGGVTWWSTRQSSLRGKSLLRSPLCE